jgi:hypothetical protein
MIFDVTLEVIGKLVDAARQECDLHVSAARVLFVHPQRLDILRFGHIDQCKGSRVCCDIVSWQVLVRSLSFGSQRSLCRTMHANAPFRGALSGSRRVARHHLRLRIATGAVASWLLFARAC